MDEIELFGFIPNGGRIYCDYASIRASYNYILISRPDLNRSQPPVFIMVGYPHWRVEFTRRNGLDACQLHRGIE